MCFAAPASPQDGPKHKELAMDGPSKTSPHSKSLLLTIKEAAEELNCSQRSVWRFLGSKSLKEVRIGRTVRIPRASIERFIEQGGER
jgi:excisionase family DNA binding protein